MTVSLISKRIGNYDIHAKIGEGGMGSVYLGIHPQIGKRVAVKVLHEDLCSKTDVVTRFFNEAKSVNDINHPNIVDIVDFGDTTFEGVVFRYIIMEFLDGESLATRIRREGVTIRETLHIIMQCASALAASHQRGVVHRDLKPENIYLCTRGADRNYVKILDFGIAKLTGDSGVVSQKTRTGMVIGTPAYMSPEQCEGKGNIDHRSDIYALGVVMYELLTGRVPFPGEGFGEVLVAHLTREPEPPTQLNSNIPAEIEAIVLHCLRKDRALRFQTMTEMVAAITDPPAHFQQWSQTAQLPPGVMSAAAGMGTILSGGASQPMAAVPRPPSAMWPMTPSAPVPTPDLSGPPVMSGQARVTGMGMRPVTGNAMLPPEMMPRQTPLPTTLSGASGEAAGSGRRPVNVLIGLIGAVTLGVVVMVSIRAKSKPSGVPVPTPEVTTTQPRPIKEREVRPVAQMVTISVTSKPAEAEVIRGDLLDPQPGKTPYRFQVKKGAAPFAIKLRLDGYDEETRTVKTDADQSIDVSLVKAPVETAAVTEEPAVPDKKGGGHHRSHTKKINKVKIEGKSEKDGILAPNFSPF